MNGTTITVDTMVIMATTTEAFTATDTTIDIGATVIGATDPGTPATRIPTHQSLRSLLMTNDEREASAVSGRDFL